MCGCVAPYELNVEGIKRLLGGPELYRRCLHLFLGLQGEREREQVSLHFKAMCLALF